jgi:hypothetical protein
MTTTNSTHHCAECGQMKPVTDHVGHPVLVDSCDPHNGADHLVMVSTFDRGDRDNNRPHVLLLTPEMADRLAVELASIAEADRRFRLETRT